MQTEATQKTPEKKQRPYSRKEANDLMDEMYADGYTKQNYLKLLSIYDQGVIAHGPVDLLEKYMVFFLRDMAQLAKEDATITYYKDLLLNAHLGQSYFASCMLNQLITLIYLDQGNTSEAEKHLKAAQSKSSGVKNKARLKNIEGNFNLIAEQKRKKTANDKHSDTPVKEKSPERNTFTQKIILSSAKTRGSGIKFDPPPYDGETVEDNLNDETVGKTPANKKNSSENSAETALKALDNQTFSMEAYEDLLDYFCAKKSPFNGDLPAKAERSLKVFWPSYLEALKTKIESLFKEEKYRDTITICDRFVQHDRTTLFHITTTAASTSSKRSDDIAYVYCIKAKSHLKLNELTLATGAIEEAERICDKRKSQTGMISKIGKIQKKINDVKAKSTSTSTTTTTTDPIRLPRSSTTSTQNDKTATPYGELTISSPNSTSSTNNAPTSLMTSNRIPITDIEEGVLPTDTEIVSEKERSKETIVDDSLFRPHKIAKKRPADANNGSLRPKKVQKQNEGDVTDNFEVIQLMSQDYSDTSLVPTAPPPARSTAQTYTGITQDSQNKDSPMELDEENIDVPGNSGLSTNAIPSDSASLPSTVQKQNEKNVTSNHETIQAVSPDNSGSSHVPTDPTPTTSTTQTHTEITESSQTIDEPMDIDEYIDTQKNEFEQKIAAQEKAQKERMCFLGFINLYGLPKIQAHIRRQNDTQKTWDYLEEEGVKASKAYNPPTIKESIEKMSLVSEFSKTPNQDSFAKLAQFVNQRSKPQDYNEHLKYKHTEEQLQTPGRVSDEEKKQGHQKPRQ